jgi:spore germination protein GerM
MAPRKRRLKIGKTGCLFWLFIFLVIIVIILYRGKGNLKETFSVLKIEKIKEVFEKKEGGVTEEEKTVQLPRDIAKKNDDRVKSEKEQEEINTPERQEEKVRDTGIDELQKKESTEPKSTQQETASLDRKKPSNKVEIKTKKLAASLYFIKISEEDGTVKPIPVIREIQYKDSPITRTIESLLKGPTVSEKQQGITSFIPEDTKLISAQISNGYLTLNFSEKFEENYTGREAILLELSQVLLTSFNFSEVSKLSIVIEGQSKRYITGEGIPLKDVYTERDLSEFKI